MGIKKIKSVNMYTLEITFQAILIPSSTIIFICGPSRTICETFPNEQPFGVSPLSLYA